MEQITLPLPRLPEERSASPTNAAHPAGATLIDTEPLSVPGGRAASLGYAVSKRLLDVVLALVGMLLLLPVFALIALCIKLDDGGPVLHFREIVGRGGRRFYALKFRTMIPDADTFLAAHPELMRKFRKNMKLEHDPRITRLGRFLRKTSLDELPQLYNVLLGQMSLVGPRIIHPSELPRFGEHALKRLSVRPGITGLWQISGRQHISYKERVQLDMRYIDTRSFFVDLVILVKTLKVFIVHTGT
jgi:lipopolysaccharide/colanic/teichoic acid biosynthesis glycosyltransferase